MWVVAVGWIGKRNWIWEIPSNPRPVIWDNPQSPVFFLICPPLPPSRPPVIFSFVPRVLVKRMKVPRITAILATQLLFWNKESGLERGGTVLHERETESWQGLFDIYEEFIQRSEKPVPGFSGQSSSTSAMIHFIHAQFSRPRRLVL